MDPLFLESGELRDRYARWLEREESSLAGIAGLEAWLLGLPHRDVEAELFAAMPEELGSGRLRVNQTLRRRVFPAEAVRELAGWPVVGQEVELACIWGGGQPQLVEVTSEVSHALALVARGERPPLDETLLGLLDAGALVWLPDPF